MVNTLLLNTQYTFDKFPHYLRLKSATKNKLTPFISVHFENQLFEVKTADTQAELLEVLKLRFEVFYGEFSSQKRKFSLLPYDIDDFDFLCDHLIVKEKSSGKVVACYRLLASNEQREISEFYSEGEFNLEEFMNLAGNKLELGRACVHQDYRQGAVISLLWKGLCGYAKRAGARYLFGCSSVGREDFGNLTQILGELKDRNAFIQDFKVSVKDDFHLENFPKLSLSMTHLLKSFHVGKERPLNSLMNMYVLAGAKLSPQLAYDSDMDCFDFFTVIDFEKLPPAFERRFAC